MATDQLINKAQGDAIISGLTAIKNAINDQPVPTQVEDVVADAFDEGVAYVPGDYCIHENKLYICDAPHHGAWDGNDFTLTTVGAVLESLNNDLNTVFMDTSNVTELPASTTSYTATFDCYVVARCAASANTQGTISLNGKVIMQSYAGNQASVVTVPILVKKGQTLTGSDSGVRFLRVFKLMN